MHSLGYFHTDVRWSNIVRVVLIACYFVCHSGDRPERRCTDVGEWGVRQDIDQILQLFQVLFPIGNAPPEIPMENVGLLTPIWNVFKEFSH
jgi:hypothetical protein